MIVFIVALCGVAGLMLPASNSIVSAIDTMHLPLISDRSILFVQELEEFSELSEEDAKLHMINLFSSMDNGLDIQGEPIGGGGDGVLSHGELGIRITRVELERQYMDAIRHVALADKDDDGLLDMNEALDALKDQSREEILKIRFQTADKNRDGWLSINEAIGYFHPDTQPNMFPILVTEVIQALDMNGDLKLDREEVSINSIQSHKSRASIVHAPVDLYSISSLFSMLDEDRDGLLSPRELLKYMEKQYENRITNLVDEIFSIVDANHNNEITPEEMWESHEVFIGRHGEHHHDQVDVDDSNSSQPSIISSTSIEMASNSYATPSFEKHKQTHEEL
eukprot:m.46386 g.46386  ORF g.46386 m.46386 type:complete len:337 (+) comp7265_c0_seq1:70-1080(+)